ncbi:hypothetical protein F4808DRAFT_422574 [Astrocystis sublimbata]|nr:hypothetical protein F4808DRAFT_422574 [Astrocystis sublimbata]
MASKEKQKLAGDFQKIIQEGRDRKRNEELAARIFSKNKDGNRRASAPLKSAPGGSLASRVGVNKRVSTGGRISAGNVNGEWTHDLHNTQEGRRPRAQQPAPNSLAARVHAPGTAPPQARQAAHNTRSNRTSKLANAYARAAASSSPAQQMNVSSNSSRGSQAGFTIKGLAGPFAVLLQNLAPGTTVADIESALTPVGGLVTSCRLVKTHPIVIAEVVFESKDGADQVIERFDQQTADGRTLSVYMKPGGYTAPSLPPPRVDRTNETRFGGNSVLVDGSLGFNDTMQVEGANERLYSDELVSATQPRGNTNNNNSKPGSYRRDNRSFRQGR